jgi:hypothetical protein
MKKVITLFVAVLTMVGTGKAQSITQADHPLVGEVWVEFIDTTGGGIVIDPPGTGLNWDFSTLNAHDTDAVLFSPVSDAPAYMDVSGNFPNANLCVLDIDDTTGTFLKSDVDGFYLEGIYEPGTISDPQLGLNIDAITLNPGRLMVPTPFAYQDTRNHTGTFAFSFIPTGVPVTVNVSTSFVQYFESDGEGTLTTPLGVFPGVLRFKEITYIVDTTTFSPPNPFVNDTIEYHDTTVTYFYVKQGPHMLLATVELDPISFNTISASYYDPVVLLGQKENSKPLVIAPNPARDQITLNHVRENSLIEVFDFSGCNIKTLNTGGLGQKLIMNTEDMPAGFYHFRISSQGVIYGNEKFQVIH